MSYFYNDGQLYADIVRGENIYTYRVASPTPMHSYLELVAVDGRPYVT